MSSSYWRRRPTNALALQPQPVVPCLRTRNYCPPLSSAAPCFSLFPCPAAAQPHSLAVQRSCLEYFHCNSTWINAWQGQGATVPTGCRTRVLWAQCTTCHQPQACTRIGILARHSQQPYIPRFRLHSECHAADAAGGTMRAVIVPRRAPQPLGINCSWPYAASSRCYGTLYVEDPKRDRSKRQAVGMVLRTNGAPPVPANCSGMRVLWCLFTLGLQTLGRRTACLLRPQVHKLSS